VAIILGFNIVLVVLDTVHSLYEVFKYIRQRGLRSYLRSLKNQYKLKLAQFLPAAIAKKLGLDAES
jgi:hypothetical protein